MKRILAILFSVIFVLAFMGCTGPRKDDDELKSVIAELGEKIDAQNAEIAELSEKADAQNSTIADLRKEIENLSESLAAIDKIPYTNCEPFFELPQDWERIAEIDNNYEAGKAEDYDPFAEFVKYYIDQFKPNYDERFYLLEPGESAVGLNYPGECSQVQSRKFIIYELTDSGKHIVEERFTLYDKTLGEINSDEAPEGGMAVNLQVGMFLVPIAGQKRGDKLRFEFGKKIYSGYNEFVNIYCGDECIGTCFYRISFFADTHNEYSWLVKYFEKNLFI